MSGKIYGPLTSNELTGDPNDPSNNYKDISGTDYSTKRALDVSVKNESGDAIPVTVVSGDPSEPISTTAESSGSITTARHTIRVEDAKGIRIYMDHGDTDKLYWNLSSSGAVTVDNGSLLSRWKDLKFNADSDEILDLTIALSAASGTSTVRVQAIGQTGTTPTVTFT